MSNFNQMNYSPDDSGGGNLDEKELANIKEQTILINPRNPEYEGVGLGIEITTPGYQGKNLDHHGKDDTQETPSAIEQALSVDINQIPEGKMATVRPDMDSLGAMAVIMLRKDGKEVNSDIIKAISLLDREGPMRFKKEGRELLGLSGDENKDKWDEINRILRAANYKITVESMPSSEIDKKILFMEKILTGQYDKKEIDDLYIKDICDLEKARKNSKIETILSGRAVFIESSYKRSMELGYDYADVIIAYNPAYQWPDGTITPKYTIARRDKFVPFDLKKLLEQLKQRNPKWGGQENIIGSPQGEDPQIPPEEMKTLVEKVLI